MARKESIEIKCSGCETEFRLWIPAELLAESGSSEELGCIKCDARFVIKKGIGGLEVTSPEGTSLEAAQTEDDADSINVLFVDSDKLAVAIADSTLGDTPIKLHAAISGEIALEQLGNEANNFVLVVSDLHLKESGDPEDKLDGEDLMKKMVDGGLGLPVIVTTGKDIVDDIISDSKWFDLNVKGFIQKGNPFWAEELKVKLKELLELD
jgi:CheY-like chemotaxis protein